MGKKVIKYLIYAVAVISVVYPVIVWYGRVDLVFDGTLLLNLFPVFGLLAISIMWLHVVGGALRPWLEKYIDFQKFVSKSSVIVLFLIIFHPLALFTGVGIRNIGLVFKLNNPKYIWLAVIAWLILVGYDVAKKFKNRQFFVKHWETVKLISTIGFFLALSHSLGLGSDLQVGSLRSVWIFYGISAIIATIYTYGVRKFLRQNKSDYKSRA